MENNKIVSFTVYGSPIGKGRPRFSTKDGKTRTYTDDKTINYEGLIKWTYAQQYQGFKFPDDAALAMEVKAYFPIPASATKKKQMQMWEGEIRPIGKVDVDNVLKLCMDALQGIVFRNDAQIVSAKIEKYYGDPRAEIRIKEMGYEAT